MGTIQNRHYEHPSDPKPTQAGQVAQRIADIKAGKLTAVAQGDLAANEAADPNFVRYELARASRTAQLDARDATALPNESSCPGCGCSDPVIDDEHLTPQARGDYYTSIGADAPFVRFTNNANGRRFDVTLLAVQVIPYNGACELQTGVCTQRVSCSFGVFYVFLAAIVPGDNSGAFPTINFTLPMGAGGAQAITPAAGFIDGDAIYTVPATVLPGCGGSVIGSFNMDSLAMSATGWAVGAQSSGDISTYRFECAVCGAAPPG